MILMFWSIIWPISTTNSTLFWQAHFMLSYLIYFWHVWTDIPGLNTSSLIKCWDLLYRHIILVPSRLILLSLESSLPGCIMFWLKLLSNQCHEYYKEYYWPNISSFAHKQLLSLILQHSLCWVCVQLGTHPMLLIHGLHYNKLSCFSFLELILVWMY